MPNRRTVSLAVNGRSVAAVVEPRESLADLLRDHLEHTGTHIGCQQGSCGACTVLMNGDSVRACLMLAVQADGSSIETVEGLAPGDASLHPVQQALSDYHGLQCGFCTPGLQMTLVELLRGNPSPSDAEIRAALAGHICRCTGYQNILEAARSLVQLKLAP